MAEKQYSPYYGIPQAAERGGRFGATVGLIGAIASFIVAPTLAFALPMPPVLTPLAGMVGGWLTGGALFGAASTITHVVPGLSYALGEDKAPPDLKAQHERLRSGQYTNVTDKDDFQKMQDGMEQTNKLANKEEQRRLMQEAIRK